MKKEQLQQVLSISDLSKRWGISEPTIRKMSDSGKLRRLSFFNSPRFAIKDILEIESNGDIKSLDPIEKTKLEFKIKTQQAEINNLKEALEVIVTTIKDKKILEHLL